MLKEAVRSILSCTAAPATLSPILPADAPVVDLEMYAATTLEPHPEVATAIHSGGGHSHTRGATPRTDASTPATVVCDAVRGATVRSHCSLHRIA
ncbi:hypothetical protein Q4I30_001378 [Leishmania utingensis]|uniref:Uncharacterized protein n=1 Tax=Leishmania utingensis TaxID=653362 RepID=A0AAW3AWB5_9TRYP